ncbi:PepSY domain-containing protein [Christiangramia aquimixticola]|uniref:PepSY domain-containing protein n=1 Tax=Christiangramia aquimixticola TaxID=1697558 RepID=UPI003AA8920C
MSDKLARKKQAKLLRNFRKVHRTTGALLFVFFFIISISGGILGWKKDSNGIILPETQKGSSVTLEDWLPIAELEEKAIRFFEDSVSTQLNSEISRIDLRKEKGIAKFLFEANYYEIQLDGATGKLLSLGKRNSDLVENIHDGSILDSFFGTDGVFKLIYTSIMGTALLIFTITGFWLWYGPKKMRNRSRKNRSGI